MNPRAGQSEIPRINKGEVNGTYTMHRRDVLKSASALATVGTVALAGCTGSDGNGASDGNETEDSDSNTDTNESTENGTDSEEFRECRTPGDDLSEAIQVSDDYTVDNMMHQTSEDLEDDPAEEMAFGEYTGPDGGMYTMMAMEYPDADTAQEEAERGAEQSEGDQAMGYLVVENYVFVGSGPTKDRLISFMETTDHLSGCVEPSITMINEP